LAHGSRQAQQERRVGIEVVRRSTAVQGGYAVDEIEASPRAPAARFRLPVVHLVLDHVDSEPKIMGASGPVQVDSVGVLRVIAFHRAPIILVAEPAVTADIEDREATLADVGTVGAGNLQYVEADVRAVIRTLGIVMHPRGSKIGVEQESRSENVADAAAEHVSMVVPGADAGVASRASRIGAERLT